MGKVGKRFPLLFIISVLILGAMLGGFAGELLKLVLPGGVVKEVILRSFSPSFGPVSIDLLVFNFVIGLKMHINLIGVAGLVVAYYMLRYWR